MDQLDKFVQALDKMMSASEKMHDETRHCNYSHAEMIKQNEYEPAKEDLKRALSCLIDVRIS
jgi:hypothetical protein